MLHIVIDGAGDLPETWQTNLNIHMLPLRVNFGSETYTQGVDFSHTDFYQLVSEKKLIPKTSLPSIGQVIAFYRQFAQPGDTVLSIHVSSKLSGTFATVEAAAREVAEEFHVIAFDSLAGSVAQGFMAREARLLDSQGAAIDQILKRLTWIRQQISIYFTLDTLQYAYLSGRISALQNVMASTLQVKPIIMLRDGVLDMTEKVRTRGRALDRVLILLQKQLGKRTANLAVAHAADLQTAQEFLAKAQQFLNLREAFVTDVSIPIAANLGPGAIGCIAYPLAEE